MRIIVLIVCALVMNVKHSRSQGQKNMAQFPYIPEGPAVQVHRLFDDSLSSSFLIYVRDSVPEHFHETHAEQVIILEGEAFMTLGNQKRKIIPGDVIYIPRRTRHKVITSPGSLLKLISVQAPFFDGKDRIFTEQP